ncbi:MAG: AsmA family protein [Gammaproteobacteria bacterium]
MKFLKKLAIGLAIVFFLVTGLAIVAVATFDPNDYKDSITEKVREETGRELQIDGDITLTVYPWLGIELNGITLSNAAGFGDKPFLKTSLVKARAKLLPLLRKQLEMDTLVLHGATINLARNEKGITNWADLVKPTGEKPEKSDSALPVAALVVGGIDIKDANVFWEDKQEDLTAQVTDVAISTGELVLGQPIDIKAGLNAGASKPALSSRIDFNGTLGYDDGGNVLTLKPMLLESTVKGNSVPGGETAIRLTSEIQVDMDANIARISALDLNAFDTVLKGQVEVADYQSGQPAVTGELDIQGKNLPQLFKIFEIEPLASQLAGIEPKNFNVKTAFDADLKRDDINISDLSLDVLGNKVNANVIARNIKSKTPAAKGSIKASGDNLPILISLASQLKGDSKEKVAALSKELQSAPRSFAIETDFDLDLQAGSVALPTLSVNALGTTTAGTLSGEKLQSSSPALKGGINISGDDLPTLVRIAAAFSGEGKQDLDELTRQLKSVPAAFSVDTRFGSNAGAIEVSQLAIKALGLSSNGTLSISNFLSDKPAVKGKLNASGPDLPLLLLVAGSVQGKDSGLASLAKDLGSIKDKQFTLDAEFDADTKSEQVLLPRLVFNALGIRLNANLSAKNNQVDGKVTVASNEAKLLLTALKQPDLAQVLNSFNLTTGISGSAERVKLDPLSLSAEFAGKQIPNSPVSLKVDAASDIDMKNEVLTINSLKVNGLGLNVSGQLTARQFKTEPTFSGKLDIAPFDLRQLLVSLNQDVPDTADPKVLKQVAVSSGFAGSSNSIELNGLKAQLDDSNLQGDIKLISMSPLNLEFGLGIDQLNLDRYLPPKPKEQQQKQAATPETAAAAAATEIPVETLRAVRIKGDFVMGQFVVSNARLSDLELSVRADKGDIKLAPIKANLYGGSYSGNISLDATGKEPRLKTDTTLTGVQTGPLVKDVADSEDISGEANIMLSLNTSGKDTNVMKQRLSGIGELKFFDGIFRGVDINSVLQQVEIMYESKRFGNVKTEGETKFKSLTATMNIDNGVVSNKDMLMLANGFKVKGEGMMVNLNDETWKYNMTVLVDPASATKGEERYNIGGWDLLIKCRGRIIDKACRPDLESMINALFKDTLKNKLGDMLGLPSGKKAEPAPTPQNVAPEEQTTEQPAEPAPAEQQQQQKPVKPEDVIKEELGKGLKKLFDF